MIYAQRLRQSLIEFFFAVGDLLTKRTIKSANRNCTGGP